MSRWQTRWNQARGRPRPWTAVDIDTLRRLASERPVGAIASVLKRSVEAVRKKAVEHCVPLIATPPSSGRSARLEATRLRLKG
jgi:hypothetical protein